MDLTSLFSTTAKLFLIVDPIGGIPTLLALTKNLDIPKQRKVIFQELFFAFLIALFFQYVGSYFLGLINIQNFALNIAGGSLLFIVALDMIFGFSMNTSATQKPSQKQDPFIF